MPILKKFYLTLLNDKKHFLLEPPVIRENLFKTLIEEQGLEKVLSEIG